MWEAFDDKHRYRVVINHEEQYSIWPADREAPEGWNPVEEPEVRGFSSDIAGVLGSKRECIAYIEEVWTDMRPLSVHKDMAEEIRRLTG